MVYDPISLGFVRTGLIGDVVAIRVELNCEMCHRICNLARGNFYAWFFSDVIKQIPQQIAVP